ncbi:hypothetical protein K402DRAFT_71487 [Aulographum hederae CBS 113979]|uniref:Zn(2)-C6 fungal-type domain-containing protein n=1 Tax=Aulographum hederae CBS 113979 TaxID=1176131 RepID=A0A6G1HFJ4_9PEZI|nr:hypothetical protein K402DRAFT_71487 [Aulographum hederae CBS 113979]
MDSFDSLQALEPYDPQDHRFDFLSSSTWPLPVAQNMSQGSQNTTQDLRRAQTTATMGSQPSTTTTCSAATSTAPLQTDTLGFNHHALDHASAGLLTSADFHHFQLQQFAHQSYMDNASLDNFTGSYGAPLQASPVDYMPSSQAQLHNSLAMDPSNWPMTTTAMDHMDAPFSMQDIQAEFMAHIAASGSMQPQDLVAAASLPSNSPGENWLDNQSLSSSENGFTLVDINSRGSFEFHNDYSGNIVSPHVLHIRTDSNSSQHSDAPPSAHSIGSWEEVAPFPMTSPEPDLSPDMKHVNPMTHSHSVSAHGLPYAHHHDNSCSHQMPPPIKTHNFSQAVQIHPANSSASTSPASSSIGSPTRRRKSPVGGGVSAKVIGKKKAGPAKKDGTSEKRVGRRRGPLKPEQRQQAHEIRKLRACLRCKFLKKVCDKGDPCGGCQPSHARLWQVPCTRIDIKEIGYFLKDWKADYERHVTLGFSVANIKGFSNMERPLFITHGYGFYLPIAAREVYVRDDKCFGVDWVESLHETPREFEVKTHKLSAGLDGISHSTLSDYLDKHIDHSFEQWVDEYFEGTFFLTEILKTAHRYYQKSQLPIIKKALKLVLAYNLTMHITLVTGLSDEEAQTGKIDDPGSRWFGKTCAPVMINFQVKQALADMWRELMKDILEELSSLYSSVYSGEKLKNWPTIFFLAAILLAVWELIQFDCHYRVPDEAAVNKFCNEMESTPVGVITGLFAAISTKLPTFGEWDSRKHHQLLNSNPAVCEALDEVRGHVNKYEPYLKTRNEARFDRQDFDCLSNKFLSKLVIRAN